MSKLPYPAPRSNRRNCSASALSRLDTFTAGGGAPGAPARVDRLPPLPDAATPARSPAREGGETGTLKISIRGKPDSRDGDPALPVELAGEWNALGLAIPANGLCSRASHTSLQPVRRTGKTERLSEMRV